MNEAQRRRYSSRVTARRAHQVGNSFQFLVGDTCGLASEKRRHRLCARAVEECVDHVTERGLACGVTRNGWHVDVAQANLFVLDVPLSLQHTQLGANGG